MKGSGEMPQGMRGCAGKRPSQSPAGKGSNNLCEQKLPPECLASVPTFLTKLANKISLQNAPGMGNALRILGVYNRLRARQNVKAVRTRCQALLFDRKHGPFGPCGFFRENDLETTTVWSAASYWNMYVVSQMLGLEHVAEEGHPPTGKDSGEEFLHCSLRPDIVPAFRDKGPESS